jgi:hypothetical protein
VATCFNTCVIITPSHLFFSLRHTPHTESLNSLWTHCSPQLNPVSLEYQLLVHSQLSLNWLLVVKYAFKGPNNVPQTSPLFHTTQHDSSHMTVHVHVSPPWVAWHTASHCLEWNNFRWLSIQATILQYYIGIYINRLRRAIKNVITDTWDPGCDVNRYLLDVSQMCWVMKEAQISKCLLFHEYQAFRFV